MAHIDIFRHCTVRCQGKLLINHINALLLHLKNAFRMYCLPVDAQLPGVFHIHAGQNLDKGGFSGTVFPHKGMYLSWTETDTDIF